MEESNRHDNAPHKRLARGRDISKAFSQWRREEQVIESSISDASEKALHQFLSFIRDKLQEFG